MDVGEHGVVRLQDGETSSAEREDNLRGACAEGAANVHDDGQLVIQLDAAFLQHRRDEGADDDDHDDGVEDSADHRDEHQDPHGEPRLALHKLIAEHFVNQPNERAVLHSDANGAEAQKQQHEG